MTDEPVIVHSLVSCSTFAAQNALRAIRAPFPANSRDTMHQTAQTWRGEDRLDFEQTVHVYYIIYSPKEAEMPQLSLYIDEKTLNKISLAAKIENLSISKFVVKKLNESMHDSWPENYGELYGSISDESFNTTDSLKFKND